MIFSSTRHSQVIHSPKLPDGQFLISKPMAYIQLVVMSDSSVVLEYLEINLPLFFTLIYLHISWSE